MNLWWKITLLASVCGILILFALGLGNDTHLLPSPLVNRPAPALRAQALDGGPPIDLAAERGKWVLVNFWGSWCVSCVAEHPHLIALSKELAANPRVVILGVDFKDTLDAAKRFLARHGDPGYRHAFDPEQKLAIAWGVYGAPETYVIDPAGTIRLKKTGPIFPGWYHQAVAPLIQAESAAGSKP